MPSYSKKTDFQEPDKKLGNQKEKELATIQEPEDNWKIKKKKVIRTNLQIFIIKGYWQIFSYSLEAIVLAFGNEMTLCKLYILFNLIHDCFMISLHLNPKLTQLSLPAFTIRDSVIA